MSLKRRFQAVIALAMLGLFLFAGFWLTKERSGILRGKQEKVRNLVELAHSLVAHCYELQQHGLPQAEAQKQAIALLRGMRYEGDNYFWINDLRPFMVMHPTKPKLDGTDLSDFKDPTGKAIFLEMTATVRDHGAGFVDYQWPRPGSDKPVPKISYVKEFEPWGWVIGTGVYIDDVDALWRQSAIQAAAVMLVVALLMAIASISTYWRMFGPIHRMVACMQDVAQGEGDLTRRLEVPSDREVAELAGGFNTFVDKLRTILIAIAGNVENLAAAGGEISAASQLQAEGAEQQKNQTQQVAAAIQEMTASVEQVSEISRHAAEASQKAAQAARHGGKTVQETLARMQSIATSSKEAAERIQTLGGQSEQIGRITKVIDDIAEQTNLLALNAAIEAARAGQQGRGFAVVSDEVRKLAVRTSAATKEIAQMIHRLQEGTRLAVAAVNAGAKEVQLGVAATQQAGSSLQQIIQISDQVGEMVARIASAATEQGSTAGNVSQSTERIANIAAEAASSALDTTNALYELSNLAGNIKQQVSQFRLHSDAAETPARQGNPPQAHRAAGGV